MEAAAIEIISQLMKTNDPFAKLLALAGLLIFGILLRGISTKIGKLTDVVTVGFATGEKRFDKLEANDIKHDHEIRSIRVFIGLEKPDLADG